MNEHLVPQLVIDIATALKVAKGNEKMMLEARLRAIAEYCTKHLPK